MSFVTLDEARILNTDLDALEADELQIYLDAAFNACVEYLPAGPDYEDPDEATANRKLAQVMQAKAIYQSQRVGQSDSYGTGEFTVTVFPLDWTVKQLLRPKRGKPVFA